MAQGCRSLEAGTGELEGVSANPESLERFEVVERLELRRREMTPPPADGRRLSICDELLEAAEWPDPRLACEMELLEGRLSPVLTEEGLGGL